VTLPEFPSGRYLTATWEVKPDGGGQTRALLQRNRMFCQAGLEPRILSFVAVPDLEKRRASMLDGGQLLPGISLDTIYDYYREREPPASEPLHRPLPDLSRRLIEQTTRFDGSPWRRVYRGPGRDELVYDYLRADGTPYLRIPHFSLSEPSTRLRDVQLISSTAETVDRSLTLRQWFREWVLELTGDERSFVFLETRVLTPHLVPISAPNVHTIQVMHNVHTEGGRRWDAPVGTMGQLLLGKMSDLDAVVTLTRRQREDLERRRGATNNLFVVPNPVQMPARELDAPRDPRLVTIVGRLASQKRLSHAVRVFERVLQQLPDARLEIFGKGSVRHKLKSLIEARGLQDSIILMGYDPRAREALGRSSAFLMTSRNEGYPLSTLESMSHGCPVISYDIRYGPREQIVDGVNGFLVPDGDIELMAQRLMTLLTSPDLVERLSRGALETARGHGLDRYATDWAAVLDAVVRQRPLRTRLNAASFHATRLTVGRPGIAGRSRTGDASPVGTYDADTVLHVSGELAVDGMGDPKELADARVELATVREVSGAVVDLPVRVARKGGAFSVDCCVGLGEILGPDAAAERAHIRLRFVWRNSVWETRVSRPEPDRASAVSPAIEVGFEPDAVVFVQRLGPRAAAAEQAGADQDRA